MGSTREAGPRSLVLVAAAVQLAGEWLHRKQQLSGRRLNPIGTCSQLVVL